MDVLEHLPEKKPDSSKDHKPRAFGTHLVSVIVHESDHIFGTQMSELDGSGAELL